MVKTSAAEAFSLEISRHVWETKYRYRRRDGGGDTAVEDTWRRVARCLAAQESTDRAGWEERFYRALSDFRFLPGGRILAGAGTGRRVTMFNCFVLGPIEDSLDGIFDALKQGALTMQQGGGVGWDFSTLRPAGAPARTAGTVASGPVSFLEVWDAMCATLLSTGARRGAMMATLRADHPDIEAFLDAKREPGRLTHFNLSVQVPDRLVEAAREDRPWPLVFPAAELGDGVGEGTVTRDWPGRTRPVRCRVVRTVSARRLWGHLLRRAYEHAEPGVLFVDTIQRLDNLGYRERITTTNPCGEVPLPPYGACDLGSINLTRFVRAPFGSAARFDFEALRALVPVAVRMLDDVLEASGYPLAEQRRAARQARRVGLGLTGLADALVLLALRYGSPEACGLASRVMETVCLEAYRASVALAREKGPFPLFEAKPFLAGGFVRSLPAELRRDIDRWGLRNSHLTAIAPTGTVSLLAGNLSSGLEPIFAARFERRVRERDGSWREFEVSDWAWRQWRRLHGPEAGEPPAFVTAAELTPEEHLAVQAALQRWVDQSISKTIQVPRDFPFESFGEIYERAWQLGLKGCTTFRAGSARGAVLGEPAAAAPRGGSLPEAHCCSLDREGD